MKHSIISIIGGLLMLGANWLLAAPSSGASPANSGWVNALKPVGPPAGELAVAAKGKALAHIEIPAQPTPAERAAAGQLRHWLKEITGVALEVQNAPASHPGAAIALETDATLGTDGYSIDLSNNRLVLRGGSGRGVLNAVCALLEEDLGWRYYSADSIRIPKSEQLVIAPVARRFVPRLKLRDPFYKCAFDVAWSAANRSNAPSAAVPEEQGGHVDYGDMFVHTAAKLLPPSVYFKDHPDYYAQLADGKRTHRQWCPTHPEVIKIVTAAVRQSLLDHPHAEIVSISKNDLTLSCLCKRCAQLRHKEGSDMANQLVLVNAVAQALEAQFPQVTFSTLAYLDTIAPPKSMRPRSNVAIRLCNDHVGSWKHPFTPARQCEIAKIAAAWAAVHDRIYVWDYNVNFSHYLAPMPNVDIMADNIRFWVQQHAEGIMLQGAYQSVGEQDQLKSWVTAKLLWNPNWDEKALVSDFIHGHYGKAASALIQYEELLNTLRATEAKSMAAPKGGIRYSMSAPFFTRKFIAQASKHFVQAKQLAAGDERLLHRVERAELPLLYAQCERGPALSGPDYPQIVDRFEKIARREQVSTLREGPPDFEKKLAHYRSRIRD